MGKRGTLVVVVVLVVVVGVSDVGLRWGDLWGDGNSFAAEALNVGVVLRGPVLPKCWLADGAVPGRLRGELGLRTGSRNCSSDDAMVCVRWEGRGGKGGGSAVLCMGVHCGCDSV